MVKEGPFLNNDMDFPTKCVQLVQQKRSKKIVDDVRTDLILQELYVEGECTNNIVDILIHGNSANTAIHPTAYDEMMLDNSTSYTPMVTTEPSSLLEERLPFIQNRESGTKMEDMPVMMTTFMPPVDNVGEYAQQDDSQQILPRDNEAFSKEVALEVFESSKSQPAVHQSSSSLIVLEKSTSKNSESEELESKTLLPLFDRKEEAKKEILKMILRSTISLTHFFLMVCYFVLTIVFYILIIRNWKKRAALKRENREQKEFLASAALSSLSLGPPTSQIKYVSYYL